MLSKGPDVVGRRPVAEGRVDGHQVYIVHAADELGALAADGYHMALHLVAAVTLERLRQQLKYVGVISAGQAGIAGDHYVEPVLDRALGEQRLAADFGHGIKASEQGVGHIAVIAAALGIFLGPAQFAGGNQLHGLGYLPRAADGR